jgi:hypothetical protein
MTTEATPKRIFVRGGGKHPKQRSKETGCLEFNVVWEDGSFTVEPIWNLVDFNTQEVTEKVAGHLERYAAVTKRYPKVRRACWFCQKLCAHGDNFCREHVKKCNWLVCEEVSPRPEELPEPGFATPPRTTRATVAPGAPDKRA